MNMKNSKHVKEHFKDGKPVRFEKCNVPDLTLENAIPVIQEVYDALVEKGLCYIHCVLITHIVMSELRDKRDRTLL